MHADSFQFYLIANDSLHYSLKGCEILTSVSSTPILDLPCNSSDVASGLPTTSSEVNSDQDISGTLAPTYNEICRKNASESEEQNDMPTSEVTWMCHVFSSFHLFQLWLSDNQQHSILQDTIT